MIVLQLEILVLHVYKFLKCLLSICLPQVDDLLRASDYNQQNYLHFSEFQVVIGTM